MPAKQTPKQFPGVSKLPPMVQMLIERYFPPDELPVPGMAGNVIKFPAKEAATAVGKAAKPAMEGLSKVFLPDGPATDPTVLKRLMEVFRPKNLQYVLPEERSILPPYVNPQKRISDAFSGYNQSIKDLLMKGK